MPSIKEEIGKIVSQFADTASEANAMFEAIDALISRLRLEDHLDP